MSLLQKLFGERVVAYYPALARALGGRDEALFLQQIAHWQGSSKDGWIFRTQAELEDELAMSPDVQLAVRRNLIERAVLEEKHEGLPRRLYYRIDWGVVEEFVHALPDKTPAKTSNRDSRGLFTGNPGDKAPDDPEAIYKSIDKSKDKKIPPTGGTDAPDPKPEDPIKRFQQQAVRELYERLSRRELLKKRALTQGYKDQLAGEIRTNLKNGIPEATVWGALDHIVDRWPDIALPLWQAIGDVEGTSKAKTNGHKKPGGTRRPDDDMSGWNRIGRQVTISEEEADREWEEYKREKGMS